MTDIITIDSLKFTTRIGVNKFEQSIDQTLLANIELFFDIKAAANSDQIAETIDYCEISNIVIEFAKQKHYQLLERFTENLAQHLLHTFAISEIKLEIQKAGAIPKAKHVAIRIHRKK